MRILMAKNLRSCTRICNSNYQKRTLARAITVSESRLKNKKANSTLEFPGVQFFSSASFDDLQKQGITDSDGILKFSTLHELQQNATKAFANNELFGTFVSKENGGKDDFEFMTYKEFGEKTDQCRAVLKELGAEEFSKIGIISNNRWEWAVIAAASYSLNCTLVPMYEAQLPSDWAYIANDSGCSILFCATQDIFDRVRTQVLPQTPSLKSALCLDAPVGESHAFSTYMENAANKKQEHSIIKPTPDDLANLVYTSGTTGKPKGVELIHSNTISNVIGVRHQVEDIHDFIRQEDRSLAFLPWAHSYGQTCELWVGVAHGCSMGICRGVPSILQDLQLVKPTTLFAVPTLYKRVYDGVHNLIESAPPLRKKLMKKALSLGRRQFEATHGADQLNILEKIQYKALNGLVLSKIRDRFGGNLRHAFVAGAACPHEIVDFMDDIGIPVCEGYGLTETSPIITINTPYDRQPGSVGKTLKNVQVVIMGEDGSPVPPGEEGEICCYGDNVMRGYHNNPDATEEVISLAPDGVSRLFHTGDLGRMSHDGWLKVTGRLKEQYKLENGKYVCPTPIEEAIGMSRFVMQNVVCGANRPHNVVLLVPDLVALRTELQIDESTSDEELVSDIRVKELIDREISINCSKIKKFEIPKEWAFVAPFTAANNMLTPKMSIRRHMVMKEYEDIIARMFGDDPTIAASGDGSQGEKNAA